MSHLKLTPSLWSSWNYYKEDEDAQYQNLLDTLNLVIKPPTEAMQRGIDFENEVRGVQLAEQSQLESLAITCADVIQEMLYQQRVFKELIIDGQPYIVSGIIDWLGRDQIIDLKWTGKYEWGKYLTGNIGHLAYTYCTGIPDFKYLVCDGSAVYHEDYSASSEMSNAAALIEKFSAMLADIHRIPEFREAYLTKWICTPLEYESKVFQLETK